MEILVPQKQYDLIYTDPPWPQSKGNLRQCRPKQTRQLDYSTMSLNEIFELQEPFFESVSDKHNIFMWTIDKYLVETENIMKKYGYKVHARIIWDKCNGIAPAFTIRYAHEYLLWFYKEGHMLKPCKETRGKYTDVFREPATVHSRKPECAYVMLEDMFPNTERLEIFARQERSGWDCFGNQIGML